MMSGIKEILFGSYGLSNEENMFKYGISFDSDGYVQVDEDELTQSLTDNYDDLKELFTGYAEKEGIGTKLKTYLDSLDGLDGLLTTYSTKLSDRLDTLTTDYETASEKLDAKYDAMTTQFAEYTTLITQMENSFASLKSIIEADSSSS
jgi:flagellar hook-associated protein 2